MVVEGFEHERYQEILMRADQEKERTGQKMKRKDAKEKRKARVCNDSDEQKGGEFDQDVKGSLQRTEEKEEGEEEEEEEEGEEGMERKEDRLNCHQSIIDHALSRERGTTVQLLELVSSFWTNL